MSNTEALAQWVAIKHQGQIKKYNGKPYITHLIKVAELAKPAINLGYEIGLCHDLLEDTHTTRTALFEALISFNYTDEEARCISDTVVELTDVFTFMAYPFLSRETRKEKETRRLISISKAAQTVKYADLIDNMGLVIQYDQKHAVTYLKNKQALLANMVAGDQGLRSIALGVIDEGLKALAEQKFR